MTFRLYNTLTRRKEAFEPREPGKVGMYVCGVTVYDYCHVGHARCYIAFDVMQRVIRKLGYDLTYVRNFTDVDDKIIKRANERGVAVNELTDRYIAAFHEDLDRLDCQRPDKEPRVTGHIEEIVALVEQILARGHAYVVDSEFGGQDVFFSIDSFPGYGKLSGRRVEDNQAFASDRVSDDPRKQHPADFALWKAAKPDEPSWDSPWGVGRPGWHIECSAMSMHQLGTTFDIHGGGADLVFPHHENEIAQSEAATHSPFCRYWLHNGFVTIDSEKMAKSLGNFFTIRDVLATYHPQALRYFLLTTHYQHGINFSDKALEESTRRVLSVYEKLAAADEVLGRRAAVATGAEPEVVTTARAQILEALADDFHTPRALAALSEPIRALSVALHKPKVAANLAIVRSVRALFVEVGELLGVFQHRPVDIADAILDGIRLRLFPVGSERLAEIETMVEERVAARSARDWAKADELRGRLAACGVEIRDGADGTTWRPLVGEVDGAIEGS